MATENKKSIEDEVLAAITSLIQNRGTSGGNGSPVFTGDTKTDIANETLSGNNESIAKQEEPPIGPNRELVLKEIEKQKKAQVAEGVTAGPKQALESADQMDLELTDPGAERAQLGKALAGQVGNFLFDPGSRTSDEEFRPPSMFGGFFKPTPDDQLKLQKLQGKEPIDATEIAKAQIKATSELAKRGNLKPSDVFSAFQKASLPFVSVRDAHNRVEASAKDPSAAGDLALIFNFMKVLDPGSTVREGEFATAQNSAGVPSRLRAQFNATLNGKRLAKDQRADFLNRSRRLFKASENQFTKTSKQFENIARQNGIDPQNVMFDVGRVSEQQSTGPSVEDLMAEAKRRGLI